MDYHMLIPIKKLILILPKTFKISKYMTINKNLS